MFHRSRHHVPAQVAGIRLLILFLFLLAVAPPAVPIASAGDSHPGRPPEVLSWRHQILDPAEYSKLAAQWQAFVKANPKDAAAWVEWGNALRYSGKSDEANEKYRAAFAADSLNAAAVEAYASSILIRGDDEQNWVAAHQLLVRSFTRDPGYTKTCYTLWVSSLRSGDTALAERCLRAMVNSGDMPRPLLEYGGNMVEGAPRNAIILTNGDNDTYPPLAYQSLSGRRADVVIANLSLLNTAWYIQYLKRKGLPITLSDGEIAALQPVSRDRLVADQVVEHLAANLFRNATRPLLYAVTVPRERRRLLTGGCLGLLAPVIGGPDPAAGKEKDAVREEAPCDWAGTRELLDTVYRTEGAIDPLIDWKRESSVGRGMRNYASIFSGTADWLAAAGKTGEAGAYYLRAVRILAFQGDTETARQCLEDWARADPQSDLLPEARTLLKE
jgi:tetratricopeptide (TPR) repeat protein